MTMNRAFLDDGDIDELRQRRQRGWSIAALAVAYAVSKRTVYRYVRGWPHGARQRALRHRAIGEALDRIVAAAPAMSTVEVGRRRDGQVVVRVQTRHRTIAWTASDTTEDALERAAVRVTEYAELREAMAG